MTDRRALGALSVGHACADLCQGVIPALLPFLAAARGWSFAALGSLVLAAGVGGSVVQPLLGLAADRRHDARLAAAGLAIGGSGVAAVGLAGSYWTTVAAILVSGVGVAAFHPDAARLVGRASTRAPAQGMGTFTIGGTIGFALGPVAVTALVVPFGLVGTLGLLVPVLAGAAGVLVSGAGAASAPGGPDAGAARPPHTGDDDARSFWRIGAVVGLRSGVFFALQAFVPSYFIVVLGTSASLGNAALTVMLAAGVAGVLAGSRLADRRGARRLVGGSLAVSCLLLVALPLVPAAAAVVLLAAIGATVIASSAPAVVLGQAYLPSRPGFASGVTLGLAIGAGSLIAAALGPLADAAGPQAVLWVIAALPVPALVLLRGLPDPTPR